MRTLPCLASSNHSKRGLQSVRCRSRSLTQPGRFSTTSIALLKHLDTSAARAKHSTHQLPRTPKQKKTAPAKHQSEAEAFHYYRARRRDLAEDGSHVTSAVERGT